MRQLLVDHCLEAALSQQPLDHYSASHHLLCQGARHTHRVNLKEGNRFLVELLLSQQNQHSVEEHRQVAASLVALLHPRPAAYSVVVRTLLLVVRLLRQRQVCRPVALQLKVELAVAVSSEVEPHQAASSVVQPHHLEVLQQLQEAVSLAVPPKLKEDLYLVDRQPKHRHSEAAKHLEKVSSTQQVYSLPLQGQQRTATTTGSSDKAENGKIK